MVKITLTLTYNISYPVKLLDNNNNVFQYTEKL